MTTLEGVEPEDVKWLWPNRFPLGKVSLFAGPPGLGKTFVSLFIAAQVSRGRPFPDHPDIRPEPADVLIATAEDGLADTIVPRLRAMDADLSRVRSLGTAVDRKGIHTPFTLGDIERLEAIVRKYPETRLLIVDPISSFYGGKTDENSNVEVRAILGPLADFAQRHGIAVLAITHFNKGQSNSASRKVVGSIAVTAVARSAWCLMADPDDERRRLLLPIKANLSIDPTGLAFCLRDGAVVWDEGTVNLRADDVLAAEAMKGKEAKEPKIDQCAEWLRNHLATHGPLTSEQAVAAAQRDGFGEKLVWKAKKLIGAPAKKDGPDGGWRWYPPQPSQGCQSAQLPHNGSPTVTAFGGSCGPAPRPMPRGFRPTVCVRCNYPIEGDGWKGMWDGDTPVAECFDCVAFLGG